MIRRTVEDLERELAQPIDMVLHCPKCGLQHIDRPDPLQQLTGTEHVPGEPPKPYEYTGRPAGAWMNPPHKSHLCGGCGHIWRPCDRPTNGVERTASGKDADCAPARFNAAHACHIELAPGVMDTGNVFVCGCAACIMGRKASYAGGYVAARAIDPNPAPLLVRSDTWCEACGRSDPCGLPVCPNRYSPKKKRPRRAVMGAVVRSSVPIRTTARKSAAARLPESAARTSRRMALPGCQTHLRLSSRRR